MAYLKKILFFLASERLQSIYLYSIENNSWTEIGQMNSPRGEHLVMPVAGFNCTSK